MRQLLEKLALRIMHYGKVMDSLAQHHPEYVALVWGAFKFVLMVCCASAMQISLITGY